MTSTLLTYLSIEGDLRDKIAAGQLRTGERLPSEDTLATQYNVSRVTLRKALARLSEDGYICKVMGKGSFVTSPGDDVVRDIQERQSTRRAMRRTIGVLVPSVTVSLYSGIVRGVEDACRESGFSMLLGNYDANCEEEAAYIRDFAARGVSGFVIAPSFNSHLNPEYGNLLATGAPFVLAGTYVQGVDADVVGADLLEGTYLGVRRLISQGCRAILLLCAHAGGPSSTERVLGYIRALREEGVPVREDLIQEADFSDESSYDRMARVLAETRPDGIFSANDRTTLGLMRLVNRLGLDAPRDIKIVCLDKPDLPPGLNHFAEYVLQPAYEIGRLSVRVLLERMRLRGDRPLVPRRILLKPLVGEPDSLTVDALSEAAVCSTSTG